MTYLHVSSPLVGDGFGVRDNPCATIQSPPHAPPVLPSCHISTRQRIAVRNRAYTPEKETRTPPAARPQWRHRCRSSTHRLPRAHYQVLAPPMGRRLRILSNGIAGNRPLPAMANDAPKHASIPDVARDSAFAENTDSIAEFAQLRQTLMEHATTLADTLLLGDGLVHQRCKPSRAFSTAYSPSTKSCRPNARCLIRTGASTYDTPRVLL